MPNSGASTTSHTLTKLGNGVSFDYHLRAVSAASTSLAAKATTTTVAKPRAVQGLYARSVGNRQVTLAWTDPDDDTITRWETRTDDGEWKAVAFSMGSTPVPFTADNWATPQPVALNFRPSVARPSSDISDITVTLSGNEDDDTFVFDPPTLTFDNDETFYDFQTVQVKMTVPPPLPPGARDGWRVTNWRGIWPGFTQVTLICATNHQQYRFQVRAVNASGAGPVREVFATPMPPPAKPTNLAARPGDRKVDLNWDLVQGVTRYAYQKRTKTGEDWNEWPDAWTSVIPSPSNGRMWAEVGGLTNFTEYQFRIVALNAAGGSLTSDIITGDAQGALAGQALQPDRDARPADDDAVLDESHERDAIDGQRLPLQAREQQQQRLDGLDGHIRRRDHVARGDGAEGGRALHVPGAGAEHVRRGVELLGGVHLDAPGGAGQPDGHLRRPVGLPLPGTSRTTAASRATSTSRRPAAAGATPGRRSATARTSRSTWLAT